MKNKYLLGALGIASVLVFAVWANSQGGRRFLVQKHIKPYNEIIAVTEEEELEECTDCGELELEVEEEVAPPPALKPAAPAPKPPPPVVPPPPAPKPPPPVVPPPPAPKPPPPVVPPPPAPKPPPPVVPPPPVIPPPPVVPPPPVIPPPPVVPPPPTVDAALLLAQEEAAKKAASELILQEQSKLAAEQKSQIVEAQELKQEVAMFEKILSSNTTNAITSPRNFSLLAETAGVDSQKIAQQLSAQKTELLSSTIQNIVASQGKSLEQAKQEAAVIVADKIKLIQMVQRNELIDVIAQKKYGNKIENSFQGMQSTGFADRVSVIYDVNPKSTVPPALEKTFTHPVEMKLFGADASVTAETLKKKCTFSLTNGSKISSKGFSILAACPAGRTFQLLAINAAKQVTVLATKTASENGKIVFVIGPGKIKKGKYAFRIKQTKKSTVWNSLLASTTNDPDSSIESDPAVVKVSDESDIPEPVVTNIEDVKIAGLSDISVTAGPDGKIKVSGSSDITTMVVGTFESAIFSSAMLSDIEGGHFEVVSAKPLPPGDHEVVIYATRPEENTQSPPVKIKFSLLEKTKAAAEESGAAGVPDVAKVSPSASVSAESNAAEEKGGLPILPIAGGVVVLVVIGVVLAMKKKSNMG